MKRMGIAVLFVFCSLSLCVAESKIIVIVKITDFDKRQSFEIMPRDKVQTLKTEIAHENIIYQKVLAKVKREWKLDPSRRKKSFPLSVSRPKALRVILSFHSGDRARAERTLSKLRVNAKIKNEKLDSKGEFAAIALRMILGKMEDIKIGRERAIQADKEAEAARIAAEEAERAVKEAEERAVREAEAARIAKEKAERAEREAEKRAERETEKRAEREAEAARAAQEAAEKAKKNRLIGIIIGVVALIMFIRWWRK